MTIHLVNPSDISFGTAVITPRWLYVLAAATPPAFGDPKITDETLEQIDASSISPGDVVGIGIHTGNALRGYKVGKIAREKGAWVIFGGIHATLYPEESFELGGAHSVVKGDGDVAWGKALMDCRAKELARVYDGGRIEGGQFLAGGIWCRSADICGPLSRPFVAARNTAHFVLSGARTASARDNARRIASFRRSLHCGEKGFDLSPSPTIISTL